MTEKTDLIVFNGSADNALSVFTIDGEIDPLLRQVRDAIDAFSADVGTPSGRKAIASMAFRVSRAKTHLDDAGKELVTTYKEIPKKIDATRKRIRDTLDAWRDEVRAPLDAWEASEKDRVRSHEDAIATLRGYGAATADHPVAQLEDWLGHADSISLDASLDEFLADYAVAKELAKAGLLAAIATRKARDEEQAELDRLRKAEAERLQMDRDAQIARAAAEKAKSDAEAAAAKIIEEAARKEREAAALVAAAEQRAVQAASQAKRDLEIQLEREAAEAARREQDRTHRGRVNCKARDALMANGFDKSQAEKIVSLIAQKVIPNVVIHY